MGKYIIIIIVLSGCARVHSVQQPTPAMSSIYNPHKEISFCMSPAGDIQNVIIGGFMTVGLPLCDIDDTVFHSHTAWGDDALNPVDTGSYQRYNKKYGNTRFGLVKKDWYKIYLINKQEEPWTHYQKQQTQQSLTR